MRSTRYFVLSAAAVAALCFTPKSHAQTSVSVTVGHAPDCPYGYYAYKPYHCAPRGYYGPEWFHDGVFIGAGPYYHGDKDFHGHVDEHFDEHHGYRGPYPGHDEKYSEYRENEFHGSTYYTPRGTVYHTETTTTTTHHEDH